MNYLIRSSVQHRPQVAISSLKYLWRSLLFLLAYRQFCQNSLDFSRGATALIRESIPPHSLFSLLDLPLKSSRVAHLYGSGKSVIEWHRQTVGNHDHSELHVAFNWSGLIEFPFDLYFFEVYGDSGIFGKASTIARHRHSKGTSVVLKTIYRHNTDSGLKNLRKLTEDGIICMETYYCPDFRSYSHLFDDAYQKLYLETLFNSCLEPDIWPEAFSSPLTIIALLRRVGYKKFLLHGFDLTHADYFFRYSHDCISEELRHCIPDSVEKPPLQGTNHDSKKSLRLNLPFMLSLVHQLGYAEIKTVAW